MNITPDTPLRLALDTAEAAEIALRLLRQNNNDNFPHARLIELRDALQRALSCAQQLERRAAGVLPPKIGD